MNYWYLLLTPLTALAVLWLFRFAGCGFSSASTEPTFGNPYPDEVTSDNPVGYWRPRRHPEPRPKMRLRGLRMRTMAKRRIRCPRTRLLIPRQPTRLFFNSG